MRSRVPIRGGTGKSILTGQSQTVVQQTIVQQVAKSGTSGVGTVSSTIWPLIQQIPVNVVDIAALVTPGLVVNTGSDIIARTLAVNTPLTISNPTGAAGNPTISLTTAALTKTDDTNVTLTLGGTPASALVAAASLTLGWTGQLAVSRGGTGNSALAALTKTDDTNVTLTLGGSPSTALVNAASIAVGWTGNLSVARGGSGAGTLTGYLKGNGTSAFTASAAIPVADITGLAAIATSGSASDLTTGTVPSAQLPTASTSVLGAVKVDGTTITISGGVISSTGGGGSGTVTSVDVSVPSILTISGNPITTSGTLAFDLATQSANLVLAGSTTGSAAKPTFRSLVIADIPTIPAAHTSGFATVATSGAYSDLSGLPGSALTRTNDTNVTLTLGGTPTTALLAAASITLGWTGTLAVSRGGSGAATLTGYLKGNGTSAFTASATIPYTDLTGAPTIPTGANPTASVGLTAVNGSATTFLRSDGAPALDQSIAPTMTGTWTWKASSGSTALFLNAPSTALFSGIRCSDVTPSRKFELFYCGSTSGGAYGAAANTSVINAQTGLTLSVNDAAAIGIGASGNVTVAAPGSSAALTINGLSANNTLNLASTGAAAGLGFGWAAGIVGGQWNIWSQSTDPMTVGTQGNASLTLATNAAGRIAISGSGSVTINAPASGPALAVSSVSTSAAATFTGPGTVPLTLQELASAPSNTLSAFIGIATSAFPGGSGINGDLVIIPRTSNANSILLATGNSAGSGTATVVLKINPFDAVTPITGRGPVAGALVDMTPDASSFTGTLTGMTATITNTCRWSRNGNQVTLVIGAAFGTSNTNTLTMTGLPSAIQPTHTQMLPVAIEAMESSTVLAINVSATVTASSGTITFALNGTTTGWGTTLNKGVASDFTVTYLLN